jgi:hypothetical protein
MPQPARAASWFPLPHNTSSAEKTLIQTAEITCQPIEKMKCPAEAGLYLEPQLLRRLIHANPKTLLG